MARGDIQVSPWVWAAGDYVGLVIRITVVYDNATRALVSATLHRDTGCQYHVIVIGIPTSGTAKRITAPADGKADIVASAAAMATQSLNVIEDIWALQITAEP